MSDFFQNGEITTFHKLRHRDLEELEGELEQAARHRPISLVLPYIPVELKGAGLPRIAQELRKVNYLKNVIVTVGRATVEDFKEARNFFSAFHQKPRLIWCTGPRVQAIYQLLSEKGIDVGEDGKGRSAWLGYGYVLARGRSDFIALHDCDIVTYSREMLARLCYPVVSPNLDFVFCKGYYSRVTDRMHGRVTRLLITPLLRSIEALQGRHPGTHRGHACHEAEGNRAHQNRRDVAAAGDELAARFGVEWKGFSLRWYAQLAHNQVILGAARNTLLLAAVSTVIATVLGGNAERVYLSRGR